MEHIGKTIDGLSREIRTTGPMEPVSVRGEEPDAAEKLRRSLGVASLRNTFDSFQRVNGAEDALDTFRALATGDTVWQMALLYGPPGNGKTHLLEALVIELNRRGIFARVTTMPRIMSAFKRTMDRDAVQRLDELIDRYCRARTLVIDEVGLGSSDWDWDRLDEIIVARYRENLITAMVTNLDLPQLPDRIRSRFTDRTKARLVLNEAADFRPTLEAPDG